MLEGFDRNARWKVTLPSMSCCVRSALALLLVVSPLLGSTPVADAAVSPTGSSVSRSEFGVNTFAWDSQITTSGAVTALDELGIGMQQFPNSINWDWKTGTAVSNPNNPVDPSGSPESLQAWGKLLESTNQTGLYIFNYDQAPGWKGGGTASDATQLAEYIEQNHIPVSAIVIGDEEYGQWDFPNNLHRDKSAIHYAELAAGIAQAIRAILPQVKIGVSFEDGTSAHALEWDQDVLRLDGPFVDFLSVHAYPFSASDSPSAILQSLPNTVQGLMTTADQQIAANVTPSVAAHLSVWVTEWNLESLPGQLSLTSTYGAAMVESLAAWRAAGAHRVFVWSFDGGPDASGSLGTFSLVSNGALGTQGENQLYPSGQSVAEFMDAIGDGATLTCFDGGSGFVASLQGSGGGHSFFINTTRGQQTYSYNDGSTVSVPSNEMVEIPSAIFEVSGMAIFQSNGVTPSVAHMSPLPVLGSLLQPVYPGEAVTLQGSDFGSTPGYVHMYQGNLAWGAADGGTSWGSPGNWYAVKTLSWTPSSVTFVVPNNTPSPDGRFYKAPSAGQLTQVAVVTATQTISNEIPVQLAPAQAPSLTNSDLGPVFPGEWITLSGTNLLGSQPGGYLQLVDGNVSWGAPGNFYKVNTTEWTDDSITFQVPNGSSGSGISMPSGTVRVSITSSDGVTSNEIVLPVTPYGATVTGISTTSAQPGESITITGNGFGQDAGYVQLLQKGTSWGAPGNSYGVKVTDWSPTSVSFLMPNGVNAPGAGVLLGDLTVKLFTSQGVSAPPVKLTIS